MLEGNPVERATVTFIPLAQTSEVRPANAITQADGSFVLTTLQPSDGVFPGDYKIIVSKTKIEAMSEAQVNALLSAGKTPPSGPNEIDLLPAVYKMVDTTPLTETIGPKGNTSIKIDLKQSP